MLSGTAGHTYGTMAISTFNSKDDPSEPLSRVSIHYWEDAINWLGAAHVAVGKRMLEQFPWWQLTPAPDYIEPHAGPDDWFLPYAAAFARRHGRHLLSGPLHAKRVCGTSRSPRPGF